MFKLQELIKGSMVSGLLPEQLQQEPSYLFPALPFALVTLQLILFCNSE